MIMDPDVLFDLHPEQLPEHKIFISHSGQQKDFAEQLCKDLEAYNYRPFFDKRADSLPKGQHFPTRIFKAAGDCLLGVVLLSREFFTRSKWPMQELAAFVRAAQLNEAHAHDTMKAHVLPVLLGSLCPGDLKDPAIEAWSNKYWETWAQNDNHVNARVIGQWKSSIRAIRALNMLLQSNFDGEVSLRSAIVTAVVSLMPPDVRADVSHVQGKKRLYEEMMGKMSRITASTSCSPRIVGVYGISGVGKSTLCMILTHFLRAGFQGRVCHVELDDGLNSRSTLTLQIKALRQLTGANPEFLERHVNTKEEGWACLKERMPRQRIFLALDNVSDKIESLEFANKFLRRLKYHADSMVLVTSRSKDILQRKLVIPEECCMHCLHVNTQEAWEIVLDHIHLREVGGLTNEQRDILRRTTEMCDFGGFHPMALKVLAAQLGSDPSSWELHNLNFSKASDTDNLLFTSMEANFSRLPDQQTRDMFMDIALFTPLTVSNVHDLCLWLRDTLHSSCGSVDYVRQKLNVLRLKSLLEVWSIASDNVCIHDLHRELAKCKARVGGASDTNFHRFIYATCDEDVPMERLGCIERACFVGITFMKLALHGCLKLQLLSVRSCPNFVDLRLQGLTTLVSLEVSSCPVKTLDLTGLLNLKWFCLTSCEGLTGLNASECRQLLCVQIFKCSELECLELQNAEVLQSLSVSHNNSLQHVYLGGGKCLRHLTLWFCEVLVTVEMSESVCLSELKKRGCPYLVNVQGCKRISYNVSCLILTRWQKISEEVMAALQGSRNLQVLDLWDCQMNRLPDLRECLSLRELKLSYVDVLLESDNRVALRDYVDILCAPEDDITLPTSLQEVTIGGCRNTVVKEICWKLHGLQKLEVLLLQTVRVSWDWELYRSNAKGYSQTLCLDSMSMWNISDLRTLRGFLHEKVGTDVEPEGTSEEGGWFDEDETESDSCDEAETVEIPGGGSTLGQTVHHDVALTSSESRKHNDVIKYSYHVICLIQKYLLRAGGVEGIQADIINIISEHLQELREQSHLEDYEAAGECWVRLLVPEEMKRLQYRVPDYVFLEAFDNFNTLWERLMQRPTEFSMTLKMLKMVEGQAIEQLRQQLTVLQALGSVPSEQKVMQEIFLFENILHTLESAEKGTPSEMLVEDENLLSSLRVDDLKQRVFSLMGRRQWSLPDDWETGGNNGLEQWRQDWLQSCKMCMSIRYLAMLVTNAMDGDQPALFAHFGWFMKMVQKIDCGIQNEIDRLLTDAYGIIDGSVMEGVLRGWKAHQWLQKVAATFSTKRAEAEIKEKLASSSPESLLQGMMEIEEMLDDRRCKPDGGGLPPEQGIKCTVKKSTEQFIQRLIKDEIASSTLIEDENIRRLMHPLRHQDELIPNLWTKEEGSPSRQPDTFGLGEQADASDEECEDLRNRERCLCIRQLLSEYRDHREYEFSQSRHRQHKDACEEEGPRSQSNTSSLDDESEDFCCADRHRYGQWIKAYVNRSHYYWRRPYIERSSSYKFCLDEESQFVWGMLKKDAHISVYCGRKHVTQALNMALDTWININVDLKCEWQDRMKMRQRVAGDASALNDWIEYSSTRQAVKRRQLISQARSTQQDAQGGLACARRWIQEVIQQLAEADASLHPSNNLEEAALHNVRDEVEAAALVLQRHQVELEQEIKSTRALTAGRVEVVLKRSVELIGLLKQLKLKRRIYDTMRKFNQPVHRMDSESAVLETLDITRVIAGRSLHPESLCKRIGMDPLEMAIDYRKEFLRVFSDPSTCFAGPELNLLQMVFLLRAKFDALCLELASIARNAGKNMKYYDARPAARMLTCRELEVSRRGQMFPLWGAWDAINQQRFELPLRCTPRHLRVSGAFSLATPLHYQKQPVDTSTNRRSSAVANSALGWVQTSGGLESELCNNKRLRLGSD